MVVVVFLTVVKLVVVAVMTTVVGYVSIVVVVVGREAQLHSYCPTHSERPRKRIHRKLLTWSQSLLSKNQSGRCLGESNLWVPPQKLAQGLSEGIL